MKIKVSKSKNTIETEKLFTKKQNKILIVKNPILMIQIN